MGYFVKNQKIAKHRKRLCINYFISFFPLLEAVMFRVWVLKSSLQVLWRGFFYLL